MLHKTFDLIETKVDGEAGTFEATVAVFNNVDKGGDRIIPGAFKNTLEKWDASGDPIPVILSHQWDNPFSHIGVVEEAKETNLGLFVKGRLDVKDNEIAKQVHRLMLRRSLKEFSFGYEVPQGGQKRAKDGANDLTEITLAEVGPTLKGMNPSTELHSVKSALGVLDPDELRKASGRIEREVSDEKLPEVPPVEPGPEPPKVEDLVNELTEVKSRLAAAETALEAPPDTEQLRKESQRLEREIAEHQIPELPPVPPEPKEPEVDLVKELQEVKARLESTEQALNDLKKKAEETDKEPQARSVDPLRKRSEELALEIASDGMSLRKPPPQAPRPKSDPVDVDALRQQSRDLMFEVLSYTMET